MVEEVFKFGESRLDPTLESCLNLQANHNEGFAQRLTDVEFILAEVTVRCFYFINRLYFNLMRRVFYDVTDCMNSGV